MPRRDGLWIWKILKKIQLSSDYGVEKLGSDHSVKKLSSDHIVEKLGSNHDVEKLSSDHGVEKSEINKTFVPEQLSRLYVAFVFAWMCICSTVVIDYDYGYTTDGSQTDLSKQCSFSVINEFASGKRKKKRKSSLLRSTCRWGVEYADRISTWEARTPSSKKYVFLTAYNGEASVLEHWEVWNILSLPFLQGLVELVSFPFMVE